MVLAQRNQQQQEVRASLIEGTCAECGSQFTYPPAFPGYRLEKCVQCSVEGVRNVRQGSDTT